MLFLLMCEDVDTHGKDHASSSVHYTTVDAVSAMSNVPTKQTTFRSVHLLELSLTNLCWCDSLHFIKIESLNHRLRYSYLVLQTCALTTGGAGTQSVHVRAMGIME